MKRYFRTIILVLVGVLLLASCGAAAMPDASDAAEERAPRSEAMMEAPQRRGQGGDGRISRTCGKTHGDASASHACANACARCRS